MSNSILNLYGYSTSQALRTELIGRTILDAVLINNKLRLTFQEAGVPFTVDLYDDGQSCCEHRYITTDDDPASLIGGTLFHIQSKPGPNESDDYDVHETMFVEIQTSVGFITLTTHNVHNGYYGGFALALSRHA